MMLIEYYSDERIMTAMALDVLESTGHAIIMPCRILIAGFASRPIS